MIDTKELRRLAKAATPGPWIAAGPSFGESLPKYLNEVVIDREGDEDDGYSICNAPIGLNEECSGDMAFIAEANPLTIEELLDRLEAAEKEREIDEQRIADLMAELNRVGHENDKLRAKIEQMERQEPVARFNWNKGKLEWLRPWNYSIMNMKPLYLAPGAKGEDK